MYAFKKTNVYFSWFGNVTSMLPPPKSPPQQPTLDPWDSLVFLGSEKADRGIVGNMG